MRARGKTIVVAKKIAKSRVLGTPKHNESVDIGEKLAAVCFELFERAYKRHKECGFLATPIYLAHVLSAHAHKLELSC